MNDTPTLSTDTAPNFSGERIVFVLGSLELGGAERQAIHLADYLQRRCGAGVKVLGLSQPGRAARMCDELGIAWELVEVPWAGQKLLKWPGITWKFSRALRKEKPTIVLPYCVLPNLLCGMTWRYAGARACIWNQRDGGLHLAKTIVEPLALRNTPMFISNSDEGAKFLVEKLSVPEEKVRVVHNGVCLQPPQADAKIWRKRLGVPDNVALACMVANVNPVQKDHATLLRAWHTVIDILKPLKRPAMLLLAGSVPDHAAPIKALAGELGLDQHVRFLNHIHDVSGLLSAVDVGVFSSKSEGCPNGVLECMASGLAVAATDIPGIREAVGEHGRAFLAPPGDPHALADRVLMLVLNADQRKRAGARNRQRVQTRFGLDAMCRATCDCIVDALGGVTVGVREVA